MKLPKTWRGGVLWAALAAALVFFLCSLLAYYFAPAILTMDSGPCRADVIVVLGGDANARPIRAAELFNGGAAPVIIVSGAGDSRENLLTLQANGVPRAAIRIEDRSGSTKQNAEYSARVLRDLDARNAIIVTSWYHSRRALRTFQHIAPEIRFYSRPTTYAIARADWDRTGLDHKIRVEYVKMVGYAVLYGIWPCRQGGQSLDRRPKQERSPHDRSQTLSNTESAT